VWGGGGEEGEIVERKENGGVWYCLLADDGCRLIFMTGYFRVEILVCQCADDWHRLIYMANCLEGGM
jgi:hypothetical protein